MVVGLVVVDFHLHGAALVRKSQRSSTWISLIQMIVAIESIIATLGQLHSVSGSSLLVKNTREELEIEKQLKSTVQMIGCWFVGFVLLVCWFFILTVERWTGKCQRSFLSLIQMFTQYREQLHSVSVSCFASEELEQRNQKKQLVSSLLVKNIIKGIRHIKHLGTHRLVLGQTLLLAGAVVLFFLTVIYVCVPSFSKKTNARIAH